jgi:CHAT domain-containing protein
MAALCDGETRQFLIQKYPLAVAPGLTLTDPRHMDTRETDVLRAGVTESVQGYPALPYVASEIEAIEELLGGRTLLDEAFQTSALESELSSSPFGIVHIASHGEFGGDPENTYLLTFDEKLRMGKLAELVGVTEFREKPLELLALSACETAAGDDRAALGLAGIAVKAGARSTLATLWHIDDQASSRLVADFYRQLLDPSLSRAAALQRAQLALLEDPSYRHPAYWSPFLLIGSWL